ncbi:hypothetical protein SD71_07425 [Cohnella kolymensis]|uniref:Lipoprotein n=1 Tax=Cohnella kolymensis TaxID=1590652 RepID=A0ABR5A712_9BACL|nr:hypothetical protein SD71_07425 [Cohnella kolymensis]
MSGQRLYGYQPNTELPKERAPLMVEEQKIGEKTMEQGAEIYTYKDSKHNLILEYWSTEEKVQTIRLKTEIK